MRLIDDREKEIENFKPEEYWNVDATLGTGHKSFTARLASDSTGKKLLPYCTNEGSGMGRLVREKCDFLVSIPMKGHISSLNASAAAAILLYEAVRRRM